MSEQFIDPKTAFLFTINMENQGISNLLNNGYPATASKKIAILLMRLDIPESETEMLELRKTINIETCYRRTVPQVFEAYAKLSDFLNRTYFKNWNNAQPRSSKKPHIGDEQ